MNFATLSTPFSRFIPAEFGADPTKVQIYDLEDGHNLYAPKLKICQMVEAEHIPYTCICYNFFMKILLPSLVQPGLNALPSDKVTIFGDGNKKGVFVKENDVAAFTISTVDKPRTLNKLLYLRPSKNICSLNELVEMWETKIGKKLEKSHISEEELIKKIEAASFAMASTSQKEIISGCFSREKNSKDETSSKDSQGEQKAASKSFVCLDDKAAATENKNSKDETSSKDSQGGQRATSGSAPGFPPNPFDFSAMSGLLNNLEKIGHDPSIKKLAEQIAKDPSFNQMAGQLQKTFHGATQDSIPSFDN
ncbi:hypothetical protein HN51_032712 [Arachis hypogaea]